MNKLEDVYSFLLRISLGVLISLSILEFILLVMSFMNISSIKNYETLVIEERISIMLKRLKEHRAKKEATIYE